MEINFDKSIDLSTYKIKDVIFIPEIEFNTYEETMPMADSDGNITGITSRIVTSKTLRLKPEIKETKEVKKDDNTKVQTQRKKTHTNNV